MLEQGGRPTAQNMWPLGVADSQGKDEPWAAASA